MELPACEMSRLVRENLFKHAYFNLNNAAYFNLNNGGSDKGKNLLGQSVNQNCKLYKFEDVFLYSLVWQTVSSQYIPYMEKTLSRTA